jgi:uncharacterized protein (TIGR04255 family)
MMAQVDKPFPKLGKPPITEAVFDLFATASPEANKDKELAARFFSGLEFNSPPEPWQQVNVQLQLAGAKAPPNSLSVWTGERRRNEARNRAVLFGPGVLALNVLPPYGDFEQHLPMIDSLANRFFAIAKPKHVTTISQRYINEIKVGEGQSPRDWLKIYPHVPGSERHPPINLRIEIARFAPGSIVFLNLVLARTVGGENVYLLDINAKVDNPEVGLLDWHKEAHRAIGNVFFDSLTPAALEHFEKRESNR